MIWTWTLWIIPHPFLKKQCLPCLPSPTWSRDIQYPRVLQGVLSRSYPHPLVAQRPDTDGFECLLPSVVPVSSLWSPLQAAIPVLHWMASWWFVSPGWEPNLVSLAPLSHILGPDNKDVILKAVKRLDADE
ncbi:hypothetical protein DSO57_1027505 [Entomophthora muscae]|uniref:Uncharacterized protein n=1 Tax=Entomophthora muscae TaxID=34485 RepID=A0ACC2UAR8_9FUNG|nr:hypothetical protein DSO57_1027505 [Entomophthora muscae]